MNFKRSLLLALTAALLCGCTPQTPPPPVEEAAPTPSYEVEVDWSKLPEAMPLSPDLDAGRWQEEDGPTGPLYPYVGASVVRGGSWTDENGTEHYWTDGWGTPVYGLMTREGKVVTDPVFQGVYRPVYRYGAEVTALPVLLLSRSDPQWADEPGNNGMRYAVAALDGSWRTEFEFWTYGLRDNSLLLAGPTGVTRLDVGSTPTRSWHWPWAELDVGAADLPEVMETIQWLYGFQWTDKGAFLGLTDPEDWENTGIRLLDPDTGTVSYYSRQQWDEILDAHQERGRIDREDWSFALEAHGVTLTQGDTVYQLPLPPEIDMLHSVHVSGDLAILFDYSGNGGYWLYHLPSASLLTHQTGYIGFLQDATAPDDSAFVWVDAGQEGDLIYTPDFTLIATFQDKSADVSTFFTVQDGLLFARDDQTFFACHDTATGKCIFYRNLALGD